jgi:AcrR family transcriptional regulator
MPRDPEKTRQRLFQAAVNEFATHGIAGARIDRIAHAARANKQLIYAYFGNKRELFETVVSRHVELFVDEVAFDAADLPGYAGETFDFYAAHPEVPQVSSWHALEPGESEHRVPAIESVIRRRTRAIAKAQARGLVDDAIPAGELLTMISAMATASVVAMPERTGRRGHASVARRRAALVEAVRRIVTGG